MLPLAVYVLAGHRVVDPPFPVVVDASASLPAVEELLLRQGAAIRVGDPEASLLVGDMDAILKEVASTVEGLAGSLLLAADVLGGFDHLAARREQLVRAVDLAIEVRVGLKRSAVRIAGAATVAPAAPGSLARDRDTMVVATGSGGLNRPAGYVQVFQRVAGAWVLEDTLQIPVTTTGAATPYRVGYDLDLEGDDLLVGGA